MVDYSFFKRTDSILRAQGWEQSGFDVGNNIGFEYEMPLIFNDGVIKATYKLTIYCDKVHKNYDIFLDRVDVNGYRKRVNRYRSLDAMFTAMDKDRVDDWRAYVTAVKKHASTATSKIQPLSVYDNDFKTRLWYYGKKNGKALVRVITENIKTDAQVVALPIKTLKLYKDGSGEFFRVTLGAEGQVKLYITKSTVTGKEAVCRKIKVVDNGLPF